MSTPIQKLELDFLTDFGVSLSIKREDLIHPVIAGNKYHKLKYNLQEASAAENEALLTFGGAFSNHILATALAGKVYGFKTIGIIRGEELLHKWPDNPTLLAAYKAGMEFSFVSRKEYKEKTREAYISQLYKTYGNIYILPEGGTNDLAVKGCEEILGQQDATFDYICCSVGTGGTLSGLINASLPQQTILGFPALKGDFLQKDIRKFVDKKNWELINQYHFGGYARVSATLINFINSFKKSTGIPLDPVYTGKLLYGLTDMIKKNYFQTGSNILVIHTGGIQGIAGMNLKMKKMGLPLIDL